MRIRKRLFGGSGGTLLPLWDECDEFALKNGPSPVTIGAKSAGFSCRAFTLIELLAVIGIIGIISALFITANGMMIRRAEKPVCMANLKNLHMALTTYLADNQKWPQIPADVELNSPAEDTWWRTTLAPYGMVEKSWNCPTLRRTAKEKNMANALRENHYVPSLFDEYAITPYRWPKMPWAMEVGNNHLSGLLVIMMDGSVQRYEEFHNGARR